MKRVAILVETALASGRNILTGISQYLHEQDDWSVFHPGGYLGSTEPSGLDQWDGDGIIARISSENVLQHIRKKNMPVVDVLGNVPGTGYPLVKPDDRAIGQMVARNFLSSGHRNFAFFGLVDERWSIERQEAFMETVAPRALKTGTYLLSPEEKRAGHWNENVEKVTHWLDRLPKPLALMVASDQFGPMVMKACQRIGLLVPELVSIIGVDNDLPFCDLCRPRLSSVEPSHARAGYEAAKLLDRLISGIDVSTRQVETPPLTLHLRASSDATAVNDPALVKALQQIREKACQRISVDEIAHASGLSRSVLQRRFRDQLGRTVGDVILAVKLRRARDMLTFTDLPLIDVAERSGFNYQEYLTYIFKKHLSTTPAQYRARTTTEVRT
ncbi:MAG: substrate-binding domain-containing protein [Opitutales bacterium]|jgi:LacI family transcriptional regulator